MAQRDSGKEILPGRSQASLHGKARGRGGIAGPVYRRAEGEAATRFSKNRS